MADGDLLSWSRLSTKEASIAGKDLGATKEDLNELRWVGRLEARLVLAPEAEMSRLCGRGFEV